MKEALSSIVVSDNLLTCCDPSFSSVPKKQNKICVWLASETIVIRLALSHVQLELGSVVVKSLHNRAT